MLSLNPSLKPTKCAFAVRRGVLLGHIILEEGMQVDPRKVEAIQKAKEPTNVKEVRDLWDKSNGITDFFLICHIFVFC